MSLNYKELTSTKTIELNPEGGSSEEIVDYYIGFKNNTNNSIATLDEGFNNYGDIEVNISDTITWITNIEVMQVDDEAMSIYIEYDKNDDELRTVNLKLQNNPNQLILSLKVMEIDEDIDIDWSRYLVYTIWFSLYVLANYEYKYEYNRKRLISEYRVTSPYTNEINSSYNWWNSINSNQEYINNVNIYPTEIKEITTINKSIINYCPTLVQPSSFILDEIELYNLTKPSGYLTTQTFTDFIIKNDLTYKKNLLIVSALMNKRKCYLTKAAPDTLILEFLVPVYPNDSILYVTIDFGYIQSDYENIVDMSKLPNNVTVQLDVYTERKHIYIKGLEDNHDNPYILSYKCIVHDDIIKIEIPVYLVDWGQDDIIIDRICISPFLHRVWRSDVYGDISNYDYEL